MLSRLRSPPLERFLDRAADDAVAPFAQAELDQFAFEPPRAIASRKMRGADRGREMQIFADRQVLIERVVLRDVADVALELVEVLIKRLVVEQDLAAGRLQLAAEHLACSVLLPEPLAPITQTSSPRLTVKEMPSSADIAVAEAMVTSLTSRRANDVALFLDDSLGKIAAQKLPDIDADGVAILQAARSCARRSRRP